MNITIIGGTGFIGKYLYEYFKEYNKLNIISRSLLKNEKDVKEIFEKTDVLINLAGESIYGRWTKRKRRNIFDSRIKTTENIFSILKECNKIPDIYFQASAIGIYKQYSSDNTNEINYEYSESFLAEVIKKWENIAIKNSMLVKRIILLRFGLVLGNDGGFFKKLLPFLRLKIGLFFNKSKNKYLSFIYIKEIGPIIEHLIVNNSIKGEINIVSNLIITYREFFGQIYKKFQLKIKIWIPDFLLKLALGEASEPILSSYKIIPDVLIHCGYKFRYNNLDDIINDLVKEYRCEYI